MTLELSTLQHDLEKIVVAKSALEKDDAETLLNEGQTSQTGGVDEEDMELMSILQQESTQDLRSHEDKHEGNDVPFDGGESSNSEQSESKDSVRLTRAAKKKATTKRNELEKGKSTPRKSAPKVPPLLPSQQKTKLNKTEPPKVQSTRSSGRKTDRNNNNALSIEQFQSLKRKHKGSDAFSTNKKQKRQSADYQNVSTIGTTQKQNELTLRVEDSTFSYPITKSQVFLFNALAVVVSPQKP